MTELLTTKEMLVALDNIIKKAEKYICIFSYNIKIDQNFTSRLRNASKRDVSINLVFGVNNGDPNTIEEILKLPKAKVYFKEYMHAKFFYNEKELLIGSMNLSEASARNNFELGVYFTGEDYQKAIKKVKEEAREITTDSVEWSQLSKVKSEFVRLHQNDPSAGKCVRCAVAINYDPSRPLCVRCFSDWAEWENEYYPERFCHRCGQSKNGISFRLPQCNDCYSIYSKTKSNNF